MMSRIKWLLYNDSEEATHARLRFAVMLLVMTIALQVTTILIKLL